MMMNREDLMDRPDPEVIKLKDTIEGLQHDLEESIDRAHRIEIVQD